MTPIKVTEQLIERAKVLRRQGKTQEAIAVELGVTQGTVSKILRNGDKPWVSQKKRAK